MRRLAGLGCALSVFGLVAASAAPAQTCVGDCGGTGTVRMNDLILGVNIALGLQPTSACPAFQNAEGEVDIAQLLKGVANALNDCAASGHADGDGPASDGDGYGDRHPDRNRTATVAYRRPHPRAAGLRQRRRRGRRTVRPGRLFVRGRARSANPTVPVPCDFLDTSDCLFPFPSDYLTVADPSTDTGRRVHFAVASMPRNVSMTPIEPSDYNLNDGFSPGASILLHVPGVDLAMTGAAPITDMARSLDADAPVVLVNASTLAHHLMWAELDANATTDATRALIIRPGVNLAEGTRYIVALRRMKDATGALLAPSADFLAYRDGTPTGESFKEARRPHMEEIFTTLAAAGIGRSDLYLAWDFTVASRRNITERLLFMRDDAFARLGDRCPDVHRHAGRGRRGRPTSSAA